MLREVLTYGPGRHQFDPAAYPWMEYVVITVIGGDGGAASDGTPGERGTWRTDRFSAALWRSWGVGSIVITAGEPPTGPGAQRGGDGCVIIEIHGPPVE